MTELKQIHEYLTEMYSVPVRECKHISVRRELVVDHTKMPLDTCKELQGTTAEMEENITPVANHTPVTALWHNGKGTFCGTIAGLTCRGGSWGRNELCMGPFFWFPLFQPIRYSTKPAALYFFLLSSETNLHPWYWISPCPKFAVCQLGCGNLIKHN